MTTTMTEDEINQAHRDRWTDAAATHGSPFRVPEELARQLGEQHRLDWLEFYGRDANGNQLTDTSERRDKTARLEKYVAENVGLAVTAEALARVVDASTATGHRFIADHRSLFRSVERGTYVIVDPAAVRDAERAVSGATLPAPARSHAPAPDGADADAKAISDVLGRVAGDVAPTRRGLPAKD